MKRIYCISLAFSMGCSAFSWSDMAGDNRVNAPDTIQPVFAGATAALAAGTASLRLSWSAANDAGTPAGGMTYEIYMATSAGAENYAAPNYTVTGQTDFVVTGLTSATPYYFVVRARDAAGNRETNTVERTATTNSTGNFWTPRANVPAPMSGRSFIRATAHTDGYIYLMGGGNCGYTTTYNSNDRYDAATDTYLARANLPTAGSDYQIVSQPNGKIYGFLAAFMEYDPALNSYTAKTQPPETVCDPRMAGTADGKIYTFGSTPGCTTISATVMQYDIAADTWQYRNPKPNNYSMSAAVTYRDKIYMFDGWDGSSHLLALQYDPATDTWANKAAMPSPGAGMAVFLAANNKFYIISSAGIFQEYDPQTDTWAARATYPITGGYGFAGASAANGKIYVFGGDNGGCAVQSVYEYTLP